MKLLILGTLVLGLSGCAAMQKDFVDNYCNYDGGFEMGTNDANNGEQMHTARFNSCPNGNDKKEARRGYRDGYSEAQSRQSANSAADSVTNTLTALLGGKTKHRYVCSGELFGKNYSGGGPNKIAAKRAANKDCQAGDDSIHCHSVMWDCDER